MHVVDVKYVQYFIEHEREIMKEMELFLIYGDGDNDSEKLDVVTSKDNRAFESVLAKRLSDKDYQFKTRCWRCLHEYYNSMNMWEKELLLAKHKRRLNNWELQNRFHYGKSTIYYILNRHYGNLLQEFVKIHNDVYKKEV